MFYIEICRESDYEGSRIDFQDTVVVIAGATGNLGLTLCMEFRSAIARLAFVDRFLDVLMEVYQMLGEDPGQVNPWYMNLFVGIIP